MNSMVEPGARVDAEPRGWARSDGPALIVGGTLSLLSLPLWLAMTRGLPWLGLGLFLRNAVGLWVVAVVLGAAALGRSIRWQRLPRPAEWLALGALAWGATMIVPPSALEDFIQIVGRGARLVGDSELTARWATALVGAVMVVLGLGAARVGVGVVAAPVQTVWLLFLAFLALWCPLSLFNDHAANWFAPSAGFGPGTLMILYRGACQWFAAVPMGVLVGLPVVATLADRPRMARWSWLEWAAAATASLAGVLGVLVYRGEFALGTPGWFAERALALGWLVVVLLIDRALVARAARPRPRPDADGWAAASDLRYQSRVDGGRPPHPSGPQR